MTKMTEEVGEKERPWRIFSSQRKTLFSTWELGVRQTLVPQGEVCSPAASAAPAAPAPLGSLLEMLSL